MVIRKSLIAISLLAALTGPAAAELCAIDNVPAATLLIPYFEVDFEKRHSKKLERTKITIVNTNPAPILAHVILWTDLSVPTFNFDIFLTGFDVQAFDVDRLFLDGVIPVASIPDDVDFDTSECTSCSESGCINFSPGNDFTLEDLLFAHIGNPVAFHDGQCMARRSGAVARGYITIDAANACSRLYPGDSGYFENGGTGVASNNNFLQATITTYSSKFLREVPAFAIEAGTSDGLSTDGNFTFYGRYNGFDASDNRECGAGNWSVPYRKENKFKTEVIVWRDSGVSQAPFDCGEDPDWYPLDTTQIVIFDQQEEFRELDGFPFPAETQRVSVGKKPLNSGSFRSGWAFFNLNASSAEVERFGHGYVMARQRYKSRQGDAWGHQLASTICGEQVPSGMRAAAQRARKKNAQGSGRKSKKIRATPAIPRTRKPE